MFRTSSFRDISAHQASAFFGRGETALRIAELTAAFIGTVAVAHAGPCTALISEVERYIARSSSGPTAAQSLGAQLHHQPTPQSVESALNKARTDAEVTLERACEADAEGDAATCTKAVDAAKLIYGLE